MKLLFHDVGSVLEVRMRSRKEVERKETEFLVEFAKVVICGWGMSARIGS